MRKILVLGLLFGTVAAWNTGCAGGDDDDDDHEAPVSIAITPDNPTVSVGSSLNLTATGTFEDQSTEDLTAESTWTSSSAGVATVGGSTGVVTGVSAGTTTITAEHDGVMDTTTVTVTSGGGAAFNATVTGDWSVAHTNEDYFVRIVDTASSEVVFCDDTNTFAAGEIDVTAPGVLVGGRTYRAEAIADVGGSAGTIDGADHKYMSAVSGAVSGDTSFDIPHAGAAPSWNGTPCP